jgi:digeranylgeranylglycerophospholipid reductase
LKIKTDIVIVGAGPAGSSTAITSARLGLKTIIIDRKAHIGVPVQCGEAIGKTGPGIANIDVPKEAIRNPIRGFRIFSPSNFTVDYAKPEIDGYIIDRRVFDKELFVRACEAGANSIINTNITDFLYKDGKIQGVVGRTDREKIEVESKIVIGADGVFSIIAKLSGLRKFEKLENLDASVGYEMVNVKYDDSELMEFYMGKKVAPRGYVWIFPKGENRANVGIGIGAGYSERNALDFMIDFMKNHPIGEKKLGKAKILEYRVGAIPVGGPNKKNILDNLILVGDAAGQVHPITGGGIGYSMVCGSIAGKIAAEAIEEGDTSERKLIQYEDAWRSKYGEEFEKMLKVRDLLANVQDKTLDQLADVFNGKNIVDLTAGKKISILFSALTKRNRELLRLLNSFRDLKLIT